MAKKADIINANKNKIVYYCTNHRINTINKKILFRNNPCNGKIIYYRNENTFILKTDHNNICNNKKPKIYDNNANVTFNAYAFSNLSPLVTFTNFKQYAIKKFINGKFNFSIRKNTFKNIFIRGKNIQRFLIGFPFLIII